MKLANDLNDFIAQYGGAMAASAERTIKPLYVPGQSPAADLRELERHRNAMTRPDKPFRFFPSQVHKISATLEVLKRHSAALTIWEMGFGKSPGSLAIMHKLLKHRRRYRTIVMCPGHIVKKWWREAFNTVPNAYVRIVKDFRGLVEFKAKAMEHNGPSIMVISKEAAKLGFDVDKPCAWKRKMLFTETVEEENGDTYDRAAIMEAAACPHCGTVARTVENEVVRYAEYVHAAKRQVPIVCGKCGERLSTNARGFLKKPHLDRYIQRKMKGFFDMLIADEVHELASASSIQGNTLGTLAAACRYTLGLTGTLIGGIATDLHAILWRCAPDLMRRRGFDLRTFARSRMGAIARNEKAFAQRYGVMEHKIERSATDDARRVWRGACGRRKEIRKTDERVRPGISPELFTHFLIGRAVFANLSELGPALPTIERILEPVELDGALKTAYARLDRELKDAIQERIGNGPPVLAGQRVGILDAYADHPWGWDPIKVPCYDEHGGYQGQVVVATPENFEEGCLTKKDRRLLAIVKAELAAGRRCCIYPQYVQVRDVRPKIVKLLQEAGIRVLCLPDTIAPARREEWVIEHLKEMDVLITQPKRVMTGLDLVQFPTLIWYEVGFQPHVLRQASARSRRPIQTLPCKVFFLYSTGTIQEHAMALMGEKEAASQALEGIFDAAALRALMNGGEDPDILAALAHSIEKGIDRTKLKEAWAKVDRAQNYADAPDPTPAPACQPERTEVERTPAKRMRTSSPGTTSTCSSAGPSLFDLVAVEADAEPSLFALLEA